jgi:hypothetical protein
MGMPRCRESYAQTLQHLGAQPCRRTTRAVVLDRLGIGQRQGTLHRATKARPVLDLAGQGAIGICGRFACRLDEHVGEFDWLGHGGSSER